MKKDQEKRATEWTVCAVYVAKKAEEVPESTPEHIKRLALRRAACQVSVATTGFDYKTKEDRVKLSYKLGWLEGEVFSPISNIPDLRAAEFIEALKTASENAKADYAKDRRS